MNRRTVLPLSVYLLAQMATISGDGQSFNASDLQLSFTNGSTHQSMFYFFDQSYINALPENRCSLNDRIAMSRCEPAARYEWDVQDTDFYTPTRKYCCFVWDSLRCQVNLAQECDPDYARAMSEHYDRLYSGLCDSHSRGSASCALRWWSILLIVLGGLLFIALIAALIIYCVRQRKRKETIRRESISGEYTVNT